MAAAAVAPYPGQPLKFIVPFPAGSGTDRAARALGQWLTSKTGQPVIVDNRPGAAGFLAAQAAAAAEPDGYTLLLSTNTTHAANPALFKKLPYDPVKDFEPVSTVGSSGLLLLVPADSPYKDVGSFLAQLRAGGKRLHFGAGNSSSRVAGELLKTAVGADLLAVPYKGTPQALTDLIGGQIDFMFCDISPALPLVTSGKLRALATSSADREPLLRDVPTLSGRRPEGLRNDGVVGGLRAREDAEGRRREAERAYSRRARRSRRYARSSPTPAAAAADRRPTSCARSWKSEIAKWATAVKTAGIQPE